MPGWWPTATSSASWDAREEFPAYAQVSPRRFPGFARRVDRALL